MSITGSIYIPNKIVQKQIVKSLFDLVALCQQPNENECLNKLFTDHIYYVLI